ncbi:unnamed protein product [Aphis gossypii]|uniref:Transmembrane protein n=1 Tax=Aphis gossypii TaxID=80765 RepID=A0A9P0J2N7_APHGO|nr:unnamed protein product [Aphis gossypii]
MCSAVRIKRSPLSPPPVYVADNQTGFVSSTARVSLRVCVCVCVVVAVWSFFSCVCTVRLYIILSSLPPHSLLSRALSLRRPSLFFSAPANPRTPTIRSSFLPRAFLYYYYYFLNTLSSHPHNIYLLLVPI